MDPVTLSAAKAYGKRAFAALTKKDTGGGQFPGPIRAPHLLIDKEWPDRFCDYRIAWAQGDTAYSIGKDYAVRKSTDGGKTWATQSVNLGTEYFYRGMFLKTQANTLLSVKNSVPIEIVRSTDDGVTWTSVATMAANEIGLASQSWCQDLNTGYLYYGVYQTVDTFALINIYRSTNDGATWTAWKQLTGPTGGAGKIRHIHSCQYDPISQRVYFGIGDSDTAAGIYRVNAAGTDIEAVVTNAQTLASGFQATAVGLMFFPNYIAWISDKPGQGKLLRIPRTALAAVPGTPATIEQMPFVANSSGWNTVRASSDGSSWLACGSSEPGTNPNLAYDLGLHMYAIEDDAASVYELGAIPALGITFCAVQPIGQAELHGPDYVWFSTRNLAVDRYFRAQIGRGVQQIGNTPIAPTVYAWESQSSGQVALTAGQTYAFGYAKAPLVLRTLYIFNAGIKVHSGSGTVRLRVIRKDTSGVLADTSGYLRGGSNHVEGSEYVTKVSGIPADTDIEFRLVETGGASTAVASGSVTYGWGP